MNFVGGIKMLVIMAEYRKLTFSAICHGHRRTAWITCLTQVLGINLYIARAYVPALK